MASPSPYRVTPGSTSNPQDVDNLQAIDNSPETIYVLRKEHPQIQLTWASKFPYKVDKLKLRKAINLFPVEVTLKADYDTNTRDFEYGCSAQDVFFGGNISLNMVDKSLEYRKHIHIPNGSQLVFAGSCALRDNKIQPNFGVALEFGGNWTEHQNRSSSSSNTSLRVPDGDRSNAVWAGNHFDVRRRFNVVKGLAIEVCGGVSLPAPSARYTHSSGTLALGEGAFHLHVAEVNAVIKL